MKTTLSWVSFLMICGALVVGCGSSSNNGASNCSANGQSGTMQNGSCVVGSNGAAAGTCSGAYPYYIAQASYYGGQAECCSVNSPQATQCMTPVSNCSQDGPGWVWNGSECAPE